MSTRTARTGILPPASPISWEAEAPTMRLPVITALPSPAAGARVTTTVTRHVGGLQAAALTVLVALTLLGGLLQVTGVLPS